MTAPITDKTSQAAGRKDRSLGSLSLAAGLAAATLFVLGAAPDITWLDSSELAAAAFGLGVAHPPGHPLPSMLGHFLLTWIPLGSIAFRCTLASALGMGLAVGSLVWIAGWVLDTVWTGWMGQEQGAWNGAGRLLFLLLPAAIFAATPAVWIQAVRVEVYGLQIGLMLLSLALLGRWVQTDRIGHLAASALAGGLALSNHHMQALALVAPAALVVGWKCRRQWRRLALSAFFVALGLLFWIYLPVRAAREPLVNWGHPTTLDRIWWVLSTKLYYKTATRSVTQGLGFRGAEILVFLAGQLSLIWAFLALLGTYLGLRKRRGMLATGLLLGLAATSGLTAALAGFDPTNPDSAAYVLLGLAALSILAMIPLVLMAGLPPLTERSWTKWGLGLVGLLGALGLGWSHQQENLRFREAWSASDTAFALADSLPPGTLLLTGYHETTFLFWYTQTAEAARPDVCVVFRHHLSLPGRFAQLRRRCPDLADLWDGHHLKPRPLMALNRPLAVELDDHPADPFPRSLLRRLHPMGAFAWLSAQGSRPEPPALGTELGKWLPGTDRSVGLRRFLLWHDYQEAIFWVRLGRCDRAHRPWARAWALAPRDPMLMDLAKRCRIPLPDS